MVYGVMFLGFGGMRFSFRGMFSNLVMGGDFILEFDFLVVVIKGFEKGEGGL